jgi:hypothetical protein
LAPNTCSEFESAEAEFPEFTDDGGAKIIPMNFTCAIKKADASLPRSLGAKAEKKYLKGKCPANWTAEIVSDPPGWKCTSDAISLNQACKVGKPMTVPDKSGKRRLVCVTNPKFFPGALIQ